MPAPREPTRLVLLRHGQVAHEWRHRIYGCHDVPLSDRGEREAHAAAEALADVSLDAVVSSGLERTEFTARLLRAPRDLPRRDDSELREIDRGEWIGRELADLAREEPEAWDAWCRTPSVSRAPGGESLGDLSARVLPRLDEWARRHPGGRVAFVAHSWVIRVAVCHALELSLDVSPRLAIGTGEWVAIDWPAEAAPGDRGSGSRPASHRGGGGTRQRPTLVGFAADAWPPAGAPWFRGPRNER